MQDFAFKLVCSGTDASSTWGRSGVGLSVAGIPQLEVCCTDDVL